MTLRVIFGFIFWCFFSIENVYNQNYIHGYVYDCESNEPVENANLQIYETTIGTSSSGTGFFKIKFDSNKKDLKLIISHLGYNQTVYKLSNIKNSDSLNICLEPYSINLDETNITASIRNVLGKREFSILDFNFIGDKVLLLVMNYTNNTKQLVITNSLFDTISTFSNKSIKNAKVIYKDCLNICHLVCKDTVYQIEYYDSVLTINYPISFDKFNIAVKDCLFDFSEYLVFRKSLYEGFYNEFYAVNPKNHDIKIIYSAMQSEKLKDRNDEINWIWAHASLYRNVYAAIQFEKQIWSLPSLVSMDKIGDSIYLFDHSHACIDIYSSDFVKIRDIDIDYHSNTKWNKKIIIDQVDNKADFILKLILIRVNHY